MPPTSSSETTTLTWRLPPHVAALVDVAAAARTMTRGAWLAEAVQEWVSDLPDVTEEVQHLPEFTRAADLPDEVVAQARLRRASGDRDAVQAWVAFMLLARWPVDVLADLLGVSAEQVKEDGGAGRALLDAGGDVREATSRMPPVVEPPDWVAAAPEQVVPAGQDSVQVRASVTREAKALYRAKRALLGLGQSQAGTVLIVEAARRAGIITRG